MEETGSRGQLTADDDGATYKDVMTYGAGFRCDWFSLRTRFEMTSSENTMYKEMLKMN